MRFFCSNQQNKRLKLISDTQEKKAIFCPKKEENMPCWKTE